jgi:hypothetical protein
LNGLSFQHSKKLPNPFFRYGRIYTLTYAFNDEVKIRTVDPSKFRFNGHTGIVVKIPNLMVCLDNGETMQVYEVEVFETDGEVRVIDCREDELILRNGIDRMLATLYNKKEDE